MSQEKIERWDAVNGNDAPQDKLSAFVDSATDSYAILQLRRTDDTVMERFESLEALHRQGKEPEFDHYDLVYVGMLPPFTDQASMLEDLYMKFNLYHPEDFRGHSLSVSDIVALNVGGVVSSHYVDSFGFKELTDFPLGDNPLKNAEMSVEDDYGMIDGVINNGPKEPPSVLEQLKAPAAEHDAPVKVSKPREVERE